MRKPAGRVLFDIFDARAPARSVADGGPDFRLRIADDTPLAIERASLAAHVLPDPTAIGESLYSALDRLERDGFIELERVESDGGPPRHSCGITAAGRQLLEAEIARLEANATIGRAQLRHGWKT